MEIPKSISKRGEKIFLSIHAKPGSKKEGVVSIDDDDITIAIHAQAQNNKANASLIEFLSDALGIPKSMITFEVGGTSRSKIFSISKEMTLEDVYNKLKENSV